MPLVKLFVSKLLTKPIPSLSVLQHHMCTVWGTQPSTTKLMLFRCDDWTNETYNEDIYVDIRAYGMLHMRAKYPVCVLLYSPLSYFDIVSPNLFSKANRNVLVNSFWMD
jgi:hypothetical protein